VRERSMLRKQRRVSGILTLFPPPLRCAQHLPVNGGGKQEPHPELVEGWG